MSMNTNTGATGDGNVPTQSAADGCIDNSTQDTGATTTQVSGTTSERIKKFQDVVRKATDEHKKSTQKTIQLNEGHDETEKLSNGESGQENGESDAAK